MSDVVDDVIKVIRWSLIPIRVVFDVHNSAVIYYTPSASLFCVNCLDLLLFLLTCNHMQELLIWYSQSCLRLWLYYHICVSTLNDVWFYLIPFNLFICYSGWFVLCNCPIWDFLVCSLRLCCTSIVFSLEQLSIILMVSVVRGFMSTSYIMIVFTHGNSNYT